MKRIRLGVDLRGLADAPGSGIPHFSRELWEALRAIEQKEIELLAFASRKDFRKQVDAVLFPTGAVPIWFHGNAFPVVHDLYIFEHPEWFNQSFIKRLFTTQTFLRGLRKSRHIFAVSEFTKAQIEKTAGIPSQRITVTHQGAKSYAQVPVEDRTKIPEHFFLALGTIEPRKNISLLVDLIENGDWPSNSALILAGKKGWGNVNIPTSKQFIYLGEVGNDLKWNLLRSAQGLLLPSFGEGFGRTALEAMSVGTPVIASSSGAIPEVIRDGGMLIDATDHLGWKEAMHKVASEKDFAEELAKKGKQQATNFSWEKTGKAILASIKASC